MPNVATVQLYSQSDAGLQALALPYRVSEPRPAAIVSAHGGTTTPQVTHRKRQMQSGSWSLFAATAACCELSRSSARHNMRHKHRQGHQPNGAAVTASYHSVQHHAKPFARQNELKPASTRTPGTAAVDCNYAAATRCWVDTLVLEAHTRLSC